MRLAPSAATAFMTSALPSGRRAPARRARHPRQLADRSSSSSRSSPSTNSRWACPIVGGAFMVAVLLGADISALARRIGPHDRRPDRGVALQRARRADGVPGGGRTGRLRRQHRDVRRQVGHARDPRAGRAAGRTTSIAVRCATSRCDAPRRISSATVLQAMQRFGRRAAMLAAGLGLSYLAIGTLYVAGHHVRLPRRGAVHVGRGVAAAGARRHERVRRRRSRSSTFSTTSRASIS